MSQSTVDDELLATRLRLFAKVLFLIHTGFVVVQGLQLAFGLEAAPGKPSTVGDYLLTWIVTGAIGGIWWYLVQGRPPRWVLCASDAVIPLGLAGTYLVLAAYRRADPTTGLILLVLVSLVLALRAALVPSSVLRTIVVGALAVPTAVIGSAITAPETILGERIWLGVLGTAFIVVTLVTSSVIYGLRRDVDDARQLGQYKLGRKVGEGGMGEVYEAKHALLKRPAAVKLLPVERAGQDALVRFEREVRYTSQLEHPNSVAIYDYGHTPDGQFYYAMEYLSGYDLDALVREFGPLNDARTASILLQAAHALAEAHDRGLVHRDIKPGNIRICDRGGVPDMVKVLDFGLVKSLGPESTGDSMEALVTQVGTFLGTPQYLAPESIRGEPDVGPAADVYALGSVGWFLLTGREVFEGSSVVEICAKHLKDDPPRPSDVTKAAIDRSLEDILLRCLAKKPEERYPSGRQLSGALAHLRLDGWSWKQSREWWDTHAGSKDSEAEPTQAGTQRLEVDAQD